MTREDKAITSKKEMHYYLDNGKEFDKMPAHLYVEMRRLFSKVFDNFESRTCENCSYNSEMLDCIGGVRRPYLSLDNTIKPIPNFGCNKFKRIEKWNKT